MNNYTLKSILKEYQLTRDEKNRELKEYLKEIYESYPELVEINKEIVRNGINMSKAVLNNTPEKELQKIIDEQDRLIDVKSNILKKHNIPRDYDKVKHNCEMCNDTGFIANGEKCKCLKQRLINELYKMSNIDTILKRDNFNTFDLSIFSDEIPEGLDKSPRENIKDIVLDVNQYIMDFDKYDIKGKNNLLFYGSTGLGKTFLCSCIAGEIISRGYTVIYQTAFNLMEVIEKYKFYRNECSDLDKENFRNLFDCDLLIIDDLGSEMTNSFTVAEIFNIINDRINANKKTIISTNLTPLQIGKEYSDRTLSRIVGGFKIYDFYGYDLRFK